MAKNIIIGEGAFDSSARIVANNNFSDVATATAQVDVTSSTTLVDATGLTTGTLLPGTYRYNISLATTANAAGGIKVALKQNNTLTLTSINATGKAFAAAAVAVQFTTTATDATSLVSSTSAALKVEIDGIFLVATAGTIQVQFAQNASNAAATSVFVGSRLEVTRIGN